MIIDTHVHIGEMLGFEMNKSDVLYMMDKYSIDRCIVSNIEAAELDHERKEIPKELQKSQLACAVDTVRFARENEVRIYAALWIKPSEEITDEFERIISENTDVVRALKFHPYHSKCAFDSPLVQRYIELAKKYRLSVVTHTGGCDEASPKRVYNMAKKYSDVNFVMVHMGLGTDNKEAINLISKLDNLYGDTTWVSIKSTLEFLKTCSDERLLFGSDAPIDGKDTYLKNGYGQRSLYQEYFNELREMIPQDTYDKIMYKNAQRLFFGAEQL